MRAATAGSAVNFIVTLAADNHSIFATNHARAAPPAAAAIIVAYSTVESVYFVQPRHGPPVRVRDTMRSNRDVQGAALSRHSLANPHVLENVSKFCPQDPR